MFRAIAEKFIIALAILMIANTANAQYQFSEYRWHQGQPAVNMGPVKGQICYLTGISGDFGGWVERVRIAEYAGDYILTGNSHNSGVRAVATCIKNPNNYPKVRNYHANQYQNPDVEMDYSSYNSQSVCFLTGMAGNFRGKDESIEIVDGKGGSDLYFHLKVKSNQHDVAAWAGCQKAADSSRSFHYWHQDQGTAVYKKLESALTHACYFIKLAGQFGGSAERIDISRFKNVWYLHAASRARDLQATVACSKL